MGELYPGYNVLNKRNSPSWNEQTRRVIDERLAIDPDHHCFFDAIEWQVVRALCDRILPQATEHPVPLAAMLDKKIHKNSTEGYRDARLPPIQEAWRIGIRAIDAESIGHFGKRFHETEIKQQTLLLTLVQHGTLDTKNWQGMSPAIFFVKRVLHDLTSLYYAHPTAWNEIGFGGPASPRGYVRMNYDMRDPWEAIEAGPEGQEEVRRRNAHVR